MNEPDHALTAEISTARDRYADDDVGEPGVTVECARRSLQATP